MAIYMSVHAAEWKHEYFQESKNKVILCLVWDHPDLKFLLPFYQVKHVWSKKTELGKTMLNGKNY